MLWTGPLIRLLVTYRISVSALAIMHPPRSAESLGRSVTSPTLRSVRRSSELSGPTLVNTSNVVLKATVMPKWRRMFEAEGSDFGAIHHGQGLLEPADRGREWRVPGIRTT